MNIADDLARAFNDGYERGKSETEAYLLHCGDTDEPPTNADRIRSMTDEELADKFGSMIDCVYCPCHDPDDSCNTMDGSCQNRWLNWLKEEAKNENI